MLATVRAENCSDRSRVEKTERSVLMNRDTVLRKIMGVLLPGPVLAITQADEHRFGCPNCGGRSAEKGPNDYLKYCPSCENIYAVFRGDSISRSAVRAFFQELRAAPPTILEGHPLQAVLKRSQVSFTAVLPSRPFVRLEEPTPVIQSLGQVALVDQDSSVVPDIVWFKPEVDPATQGLQAVGGRAINRHQPRTVVSSFVRRSRFPRGGLSSLAVNE